MAPALYKSFAEMIFVVRTRPPNVSYPGILMWALKNFRKKIIVLKRKNDKFESEY